MWLWEVLPFLREYLSLAFNVLRNSPSISNLTKKDFPHSIHIRMMMQEDKSNAMKILTLFGTP